MKKFIAFSVRYPVTILMFVLGILLLGYISFRKLGVELFPELATPKIFVELKAGEKPPEEIEMQLVDRIESLAIRQKKVSQVSSVSQVGAAQITVEYGWDADMDDAFLELQKALASFSQSGDIDELNITQHDPNAEPVFIVALSHPQIDDMNELRKVAENYIRNELIRLEGIADVTLSGQEEKEVVIETDPYRLQAHGLSSDDITSRIQNYSRNVSGGSIVEMGQQYIVKGIGVFQTLEDIQNLVITYLESDASSSGDGNTASSQKIPVFLKDVADVSFRNADPDNIVRIDQKRCIALSIYKETRTNTLSAINQLTEALGDIRKALPGYILTIVQNQGSFIKTAVNEVQQSLLIGAFLAVIVLYFFLRRIGATLVISLAIPISVVAAFSLMYFGGLTLNVMTLGGLALGVGMLVDNAIVVMENISRHAESGLSVRDSSVEGTAQVGGAITASTLTTIVVFLPIVYLHGVSGELFRDQAWTVAFSLVSSLLVAILVIPPLSAAVLRKEGAFGTSRSSIRFPWYPPLLGRILNRKRWILAGSVVLVAICLLLIPIVGSEFLPKVDAREFSIDLAMPAGTELRRTESLVQSLESMITARLGGDLELLFSQTGETVSLGSDENTLLEGENTAVVRIRLKKRNKRNLEPVIASLEQMLKGIPDLEFEFRLEQTALRTALGTDEAPIVLEISGEEMEELELLTAQAKQKIESDPDVFNVQTNFEEGAPEIEVMIDRLKSGLYNISVNGIGTQVSEQLLGTEITQWEHEGDILQIRLRMPEPQLHQLENLIIRSGSQQYRLDEIATFRRLQAPKAIYRRNQTRIGRVTAQIREGKSFSAVARHLESLAAQISLPSGYKTQLTGEELKRKESFRSLSLALLLSMVLMYMVLASQFESILHPLIIMLTVPLAGAGAILLFFILGKTLNIMAYIGLIMLAGIAVNNAIILVDAVNQLKRSGLSRREAILEAGGRRIRPILMTSLTTILALLPLCFGWGEGAALRSPMALAVIGGLTTSTLLTLVVIPCVYEMMDEWREKWIPLRLRRKSTRSSRRP